MSTQIWLPERADVLVSELIGDEPLAERVIGITQDALRRLLKPGARLLPSGIKIFGLPVTVPVQELSKHTFTSGTLQSWQSWYNIDFAPLVKIVHRSFLNSLFGYFINPYTMRHWKTLSAPVLLARFLLTGDVGATRHAGNAVHRAGDAVVHLRSGPVLRGGVRRPRLGQGDRSDRAAPVLRVAGGGATLEAGELFPAAVRCLGRVDSLFPR